MRKFNRASVFLLGAVLVLSSGVPAIAFDLSFSFHFPGRARPESPPPKKPRAGPAPSHQSGDGPEMEKPRSIPPRPKVGSHPPKSLSKPRSISSFSGQPDDVFRIGAKAYKEGQKEKAFEALNYAAVNGHMASQWKLGEMYAQGDGVSQDRGRAYDIFNEIVAKFGDARPGSVEARYVSDAIVKLSAFLRVGIDKKVPADKDKARDYLSYAATYFRDPDAQYQLALNYLENGDGNENVRLAVRWLSKAARKGHVLAQMRLGDLLLEGDKVPAQPVNGLKWLTIARMLDEGNSEVRDRQEAAFALADAETRKIAVGMAEEWVNGAASH